MLKSVLTSLVLASCGTQETIDRWRGNPGDIPSGREGAPIQGDKDLLAVYHSELKKQADLVGNYGQEDAVFSVTWENNMEVNYVGLCIYKSFQNNRNERHIKINVNLKDDEKKLAAVMAHEIGHCVWNEDHFEDTDDIMNAFVNYKVVQELDKFRPQMMERVKK